MSQSQYDQIRANAEQGRPAAQFLLSQICAQNQDFSGMIHWLKRARASGFAEANAALGHCYEKGQGLERDFALAMDCYDEAIQVGSPQAAYNKATLLYKSKQATANSELICELLVIAAKGDVLPALRSIGYLAIQLKYSRKLGLACLRKAAAMGDPVSIFNLSWFLLRTRDEENHHSEAAFWLPKALAARYPLAETLMAEVGHVRAVPPTANVDQLIDFDQSFSLFPERQPVEQKVMSESPEIKVFHHVLNRSDCAYLIYLSGPYLSRANVIDPASQKGGMVSDVRTSMSTYLTFSLVDIISRYAELKIIVETGEDLVCSEPISILYYSPGEYYRPHVDYFNPQLKVSKALLEDGGQRTSSAVTYMTAPSSGGGTSFPKLNLTVPATAGSSLWFRNCLDNGDPDNRTLHAGDPVEQGDKWVLTKWFRQQPTSYLEL
jgi:hypothetical protein